MSKDKEKDSEVIPIPPVVADILKERKENHSQEEDDSEESQEGHLFEEGVDHDIPVEEESNYGL